MHLLCVTTTETAFENFMTASARKELHNTASGAARSYFA